MTWKPDIFIYHSPCDDGFAAAWAAYRRWGDTVEYAPCSYGKLAPDVTGKHVLIGDFSFKRPVLEGMLAVAKSIVILDHHKTAQEDLAPFIYEPDHPGVLGVTDIDGMLRDLAEMDRPPCIASFDMDRSGASMLWNFCHPEFNTPLLIRMVEDRDLWRFHLSDTRAFTLWLRSHPYDFDTWSQIARQLADNPGDILGQATAIEAFYDRKVAEMVREAQPKQINGHVVPVVNCSWAFASDVAHALLKANPAAPFAACYYDRGDGSRTYSLRSEDHRLDVSAIAKRYGGGGHRNAAGFEVPLP